MVLAELSGLSVARSASAGNVLPAGDGVAAVKQAAPVSPSGPEGFPASPSPSEEAAAEGGMGSLPEPSPSPARQTKPPKKSAGVDLDGNKENEAPGSTAGSDGTNVSKRSLADDLAKVHAHADDAEVGAKSREFSYLSTARSPPEIWAIEGSISSGKSTLTKWLSSAVNAHGLPGAQLVDEPVQHKFLKAFYASPTKYAFAFQLNMLQTRITSLLESHRAEQGTFVLDRCVFGDNVFAVKNFVDGAISEDEMAIYAESREMRGYGALMPGPTRMVYLDCPPEVCHMRMTSVRKHDAEAGVPFEYLDGIDAVYINAVVAQYARADVSVDIIVIEAGNNELVEGGKVHLLEELVLGEGPHEARRALFPRRSQVAIVDDLEEAAAVAGRGEVRHCAMLQKDHILACLLIYPNSYTRFVAIPNILTDIFLHHALLVQGQGGVRVQIGGGVPAGAGEA